MEIYVVITEIDESADIDLKSISSVPAHYINSGTLFFVLLSLINE